MQTALRVAGLAVAAVLTLTCAGPGSQPPAGRDPLPSWNDGPLKQRIIAFVRAATDQGGPDFVPPAERIATLDNDGTLWAEQPLPNEVFFMLDRLKELAPRHPEWKDRQPFKAVLEHDKATLHTFKETDVAALIAATHTGLTTDEFAQAARDWFDRATHPTLKRPLREVTYRPMRELLDYLRASGFKTYIVSGGTSEFMRVFADRLYGIPPEQVIGSSFKTREEVRDGKPVLVILPELLTLDDKEDKPVNIHLHIGRVPVFAAGNVRSGGDVAMLRYCQTNRRKTFQLMVNHDDANREFAYAEKDRASLDAAERHGWNVVNMKADWRVVFAPQK